MPAFEQASGPTLFLCQYLPFHALGLGLTLSAGVLGFLRLVLCENKQPTFSTVPLNDGFSYG